MGRDDTAVSLWRRLRWCSFWRAWPSTKPARDSSGIHGEDIYLILLWAVVSLVFFIVNAVLLIIALGKGRLPAITLIACALPIFCILFPMVRRRFPCGDAIPERSEALPAGRPA